VQAHTDFGVWPLGEPELKRQLAANTIDPGSNEIKRTVIDLELTSERCLRALEFMPSERRVIRAAFFTVQETGQMDRELDALVRIHEPAERHGLSSAGGRAHRG